MQACLARRLAFAIFLSLALRPALAARAGAHRAGTAKAGAKAEGPSDEDAIGFDGASADAPEGAGPEGAGDDAAAAGGSPGGVDVAGLQRSLQEGGVDGLNKMLKAFQSMGSLGSSVDAHVKRDANGNEVYDFRDLDEPGASTPAPGSDPVPLAPQTQTALASAGAGKAQPGPASGLPTAVAGTENVAGATKDQPRRPESATPGPQAAAHPAGAAHVAGVQKVEAATAGSAPHAAAPKRAAGAAVEKVDASKPASTPTAAAPARTAVTSPEAAKPVPAPVAATPKAAGPAAAKVEVAKPASVPVAATPTRAPAAAAERAAQAQEVQPSEKQERVPSASSVAQAEEHEGQLADITRRLEEVRRGVDTLVTLGLHDRGTQPVQAFSQPGVEERLLLGRLDELERQNSQLQAELRAQAERLQAVEALQQKDDEQLSQVAHENKDLRGELAMVQGRKVTLSQGARHAARRGRRDVRTVFHSKGKASSER